MGKLALEPSIIEEARAMAGNIAREVQGYIDAHTTTSVERAILRLYGVDGVNEDGVPLPNVVVNAVAAENELSRGIAWWISQAVLHYGLSPQEIAQAVAEQKMNLLAIPAKDPGAIRETADRLAQDGLKNIAANRRQREKLLAEWGEGPEPYLYVIVATGNIYEDVKQAQLAARQGADIIAVIRTTGQSLLDYVPYGPTTEGFGGTYATQANFRIMREKLDEVGRELGRYIRLTNYCSGLCMPEIAAMGALERLDVMLNDAMYGIIFRDINMCRTFVDQFFSRVINGYAGIIINTGEDNYLTTADAFTQGHTVLASQFINEQLAKLSGIPEEQMGLGHAFEINPALEDSFLYEVAQAQLVREIFPRSPIKYMPPTKYMTGNVFQGHVQDTMFNAASIMTGQSIHLLGMLTEALHTPLLQDRYLSIINAKYVFNSMRHLAAEISFRPDGIIQRRAREVLGQALVMLREIESIGLMEAISRKMFADIARTPAGGRGLNGVVRKAPEYYNPFIAPMLGRECL